MNCLIIEDEAPAQRLLARYVADVPNLRLVGVENNAISGLTRLETQEIDLIFLDINLPKLTGIEFLRTLRRPPLVILTTAYPEYALESYELDVIDYLLKPFTFARFLRAVRKAGDSGRLRDPQVPPATAIEHFFVRIDKVTHRVPFAKLQYCRAEGDFVRIVLEDRTLLASQTLASLEKSLAPAGVIRVHRSYLLRLDALQKLQGNQVYTSRGIIPVGRKYRETLLAWMAR